MHTGYCTIATYLYAKKKKINNKKKINFSATNENTRIFNENLRFTDIRIRHNTYNIK